MDGSLPTATSPQYRAPIDLAKADPSKLRARTFLDGRGSTILAGSKPEGVASWTAKQLAAATGPLEFDVSSELKAPGIWRATFLFTSGSKAVTISNAEILVNGKSVATDAHSGKAGTKHQDNTYRFDVPQVPAHAKVSLRAKFEGDGGKDSNGSIVLVKSERLEPAARVETKIGGYQDHVPAMAADWNDDTYFWTNHEPDKDDTVTWWFDQPVAAGFAGVPTGERNGTKDQAVGAVLEYSTDGTAWKKVADYAYGNAEGRLPAGTLLKGLRIRFTEKQKTWVITRDPVLKKTAPSA
jgi:hexosaminidase